MPPPEARIADISAGLAAVGLTPQLKEYGDRTSIEARLPDSFPAGAWSAVLALLESADWFGLVNSRVRGLSLWAVISKSDPAATYAAEGPHVQP